MDRGNGLRQVFHEWRMNLAQRSDDKFGIELSTLGTGMGVIFGKEQGSLLRPHRLKAVRFEGGHIGKGNVIFGGKLPYLAVVTHIAFNVLLTVRAVTPDIANRERKQNGCGVLGSRVGDIFAQIPSKGVHCFHSSIRESDLFALLSEPFQAAAWLCSTKIAAVVVSELEQHVISGLHLPEHFVPGTLALKGTAAASGDGSIGDVDAGSVEEVGNVVSPSKIRLIARRRVARFNLLRSLRRQRALAAGWSSRHSRVRLVGRGLQHHHRKSFRFPDLAVHLESQVQVSSCTESRSAR